MMKLLKKKKMNHSRCNLIQIKQIIIHLKINNIRNKINNKYNKYLKYNNLKKLKVYKNQIINKMIDYKKMNIFKRKGIKDKKKMNIFKRKGSIELYNQLKILILQNIHIYLNKLIK